MALFRRKPVPQPVAEPAPEAPLPRRTLAEQRDRVLTGVEPLVPVGLPLSDAVGLTLCEDIVSDLELPMVTTAALDGFGIRAANIVGASESHPIDLRLVAAIESTDALSAQAVAPGACVRLAAGAPIPAGVDAVVPEALATAQGRRILFTGEARINANLVMRGSALADGAKLLSQGSVLDARGVGTLAEVGLDRVLVRRRPKVTIASVGEHLLAPGEAVTHFSQRYAASVAMLAAAAAADGAEVTRIAVKGRDAAELRERLTTARDEDVVCILTADELDAHLVAQLLGEVGEVESAHLALNDGGASNIGRLGDARVITASAAPVTALGVYLGLVRPLLAALAGRGASEVERVRVRDAVASALNERVIPARLADDRAVPITAPEELANSLVDADGLLLVPADGVEADAEASWWRFGATLA